MRKQTRLLSVKQAAEILGIKIGTLYKWRHNEKVPYVKLGGKLCFKESDIEAFIEANWHETFSC